MTSSNGIELLDPLSAIAERVVSAAVDDRDDPHLRAHSRKLQAELAKVGLEIVPLRERAIPHEFLPHSNPQRHTGCARCPYPRQNKGAHL